MLFKSSRTSSSPRASTFQSGLDSKVVLFSSAEILSVSSIDSLTLSFRDLSSARIWSASESYPLSLQILRLERSFPALAALMLNPREPLCHASIFSSGVKSADSRKILSKSIVMSPLFIEIII